MFRSNSWKAVVPCCRHVLAELEEARLKQPHVTHTMRIPARRVCLHCLRFLIFSSRKPIRASCYEQIGSAAAPWWDHVADEYVGQRMQTFHGVVRARTAGHTHAVHLRNPMLHTHGSWAAHDPVLHMCGVVPPMCGWHPRLGSTSVWSGRHHGLRAVYIN